MKQMKIKLMVAAYLLGATLAIPNAHLTETHKVEIQEKQESVINYEPLEYAGVTKTISEINSGYISINVLNSVKVAQSYYEEEQKKKEECKRKREEKRKQEELKKKQEEENKWRNSLIKVEATAFCDSGLADGTTPRSNFTLAGKVSWMKKACYLYRCNSDGSVGEKMGYYEFHDVGYGQSTGYGSSKLVRGRSLGTIEEGSCIDIWMSSESECERWGRRNVYIEFVEK